MKNSVKSLLRSRNSGLLAGLLIMLALAAGITPKLFVPSTIISMLRNNCIYVFLAVAEFIVIISGAIDLSGPAILSFTACFSAVQQMNHPDTPVIVWVLISLVIGVACGAVNGLLVYKLKMNPMIATLGSQYVIRGFAFMVSNGVTIFPHQVSESFQNLATGKFLGFQAILWYAVVVMILAAIFLDRTMLGRHVYAIGSNMESARIAGLNTGKISITAYMISGFLAAFAGVMYIANFANVSYQVANGYEMTAIAISILGGASVTGGKGQVSGLVLSVMMIAVINSFLSMLPGMNLWSDAIQGLIILVAVVLNKSLAQREHLQELKEQEALL